MARTLPIIIMMHNFTTKKIIFLSPGWQPGTGSTPYLRRMVVEPVLIEVEWICHFLMNLQIMTNQ